MGRGLQIRQSLRDCVNHDFVFGVFGVAFFVLPWAVLPWAPSASAEDRAGLNQSYQDLYRAARQKPGMSAAEFDAKRKELVVPVAQKNAKERSEWVESVLEKAGITRVSTPMPPEPNDDPGGDQPDSPEISEEEAETFPLFGEKSSGTERGPAQTKTNAPKGQQPSAKSKKPESSRPAPARPAQPEVQLDGSGVTILDFSK
jgi:hypothetical protein